MAGIRFSHRGFAIRFERKAGSGPHAGTILSRRKNQRVHSFFFRLGCASRVPRATIVAAARQIFGRIACRRQHRQTHRSEVGLGGERSRELGVRLIGEFDLVNIDKARVVPQFDMKKSGDRLV